MIAFCYHVRRIAGVAQVLVRNLNAKVVSKLKARARQHRRSLQEELKEILEQAAGQNSNDVLAKVNEVRQLFAGRKFGDSSALIRKDRAR
jgi:plasmid stability protein